MQVAAVSRRPGADKAMDFWRRDDNTARYIYIKDECVLLLIDCQ